MLNIAQVIPVQERSSAQGGGRRRRGKGRRRNKRTTMRDRAASRRLVCDRLQIVAVGVEDEGRVAQSIISRLGVRRRGPTIVTASANL